MFNYKQLWILTVAYVACCISYMILFDEPDCMPNDWHLAYNDCDDLAKILFVPPALVFFLNFLYSLFIESKK